MLPACRTAGEPFALPQFALTRSDIETFMDESVIKIVNLCFYTVAPRADSAVLCHG